MIPKVDFSNFKIKDKEEEPEVMVVTDYEGKKIDKDTLTGDYEIQQFLNEYFNSKEKDNG